MTLHYEQVPPRDQDFIWNDKGSGADSDGSFWGAQPSNQYYPLGDAVCRQHGSCRDLIRVKELSPDNILRKEIFNITFEKSFMTQRVSN